MLHVHRALLMPVPRGNFHTFEIMPSMWMFPLCAFQQLSIPKLHFIWCEEKKKKRWRTSEDWRGACCKGEPAQVWSSLSSIIFRKSLSLRNTVGTACCPLLWSKTTQISVDQSPVLIYVLFLLSNTYITPSMFQYSSKCFPNTEALDPHSTSKHVRWISPLYRWGNQGTEKSHSLGVKEPECKPVCLQHLWFKPWLQEVLTLGQEWNFDFEGRGTGCHESQYLLIGAVRIYDPHICCVNASLWKMTRRWESPGHLATL